MSPINTLFVIISLLLVIIDIKYKIVPNILLLLLGVSLVEHNFHIGILIESLGNGIIAFLIFSLIYIFSNRGIGLGDIKYTSLTACCFGFKFWISSLLITSVTALIILTPIYLLGGIDRRTKIPFIPFLVSGVIINLLLV